MSEPLLDQTFDSWLEAFAELERCAAVALEAGQSLAELVAVYDPVEAHVELLARDDFRALYRRPAERAFVDHADARDAIRVVMLDHKAGGRSMLLPAAKEALMLTALESMTPRTGRQYV